MGTATKEGSAITKEEKVKMKDRIRRSLHIFEICQEKHEEIRKFNQILEESRILLSGRECNKGMMEEVTRRYMGEIRQVTKQIHEILDERRRVEYAMGCLEAEEEQFLILRYEKRYDYTRICYEMHMSRARCFRVQDKALLHMKQALDTVEDC